MTSALTPELDAAIREGNRDRDRENMQPTIDHFHRLLAGHPGNPHVLYELGGAYDTAGREGCARGYYEQAMGAGLDWKTSLQELTAAKGLGVPEYVVGESGPDHQKAFTAAAVVKGEVHGEGAGRSKKEAEQQAAEAAWRDLSASA